MKKNIILSTLIAVMTVSTCVMASADESVNSENVNLESAVESVNPESVVKNVESKTVTEKIASSASTRSGSAGYVSANNVAFRRSPGFNTTVIYNLNYGTSITITGTTRADDALWAKVTYKGISGYIYYGYVEYGNSPY